MAISSSLYSGISGLNTNGNAMSVIGNNIANTNTVGFKSSRAVFSDLLSGYINGSGGASQVGRGTGLSIVDNIFGQGTFESTESNTDLAIEGEGLFVLREADNNTTFYSRAGAFRFNGDGYLVNPEGYRVQGKPFDINGNLSAGDSSDIQIDINSAIPAHMTANMFLATNLDSNSAVVSGPFDINDATTYNYASSNTIFDSLGNTHMLTTYFGKTADNTWEYNVVDEANNIVATSGGTPLTFDSNGEQLTGGTLTISGLNWGGGTGAQDIVYTLQTTQYANDSQVFSQDQDGFGPGSLMKISIDGEGTVTANYSNGERIKISRIVLAKFANFSGLVKEGQNMYSATDAAGPPRVGVPGAELGTLFTNALEQSTVDLAAEFVKMITTQRGFQANSRVITTTDEMLSELINLKR
ncbi:MAG: flagellar hook protein FlgE [Syntrophotaleaceae bacterium]